ncbi:MAG: ATP-dependent DNA helicase RecG [Lachnospiraceae bacterium]|nr:ATP-dependent DNA helicase RecG [Lachnospiraceae bacterium]
MEEKAKLKTLKGIGDKTAALFARLGIFTVEDLLRHYPLGYDTLQEQVSMREIKAGAFCVVRGRLAGAISTRHVRGRSISVCKVSDGTGEVSLIFFHMPYLSRMIQPDMEYLFRGVVQGRPGSWKMEQPGIYTPKDYEERRRTLQPGYSLTSGLTNNTVTKAMRQALSLEAEIREYLPAEIRAHYKLIDYKDALWGIHFPEDRDMLQQARRRLVFDEFFLFMVKLLQCRMQIQQVANRWPVEDVEDTARLLAHLPYSLTSAQMRVWEEIRTDLRKNTVMNRLVQGDVGSGKTILAILALLEVAANGFQGALMAPTEVLARQHFEQIEELTERYGLPFSPVLLTGSMTAREKRTCYGLIEGGEANVIIGTHALIQEKAVYKNLALVVTDEQHRFGVRQREALAGKGMDTHVLVMSATPIPRTLALILYGDLHISVVDELPADRLPIKNCVVDTGYREKAYRFIRGEIQKGRQVYIICPMVEAGELEGLENVMDYTEKLRDVFSDAVRISHLHGKMKPAEKNRVMEAFGRGETDILVSTTVIEVGINVPNATVMMVENAERFGLAQLHQLRGRVGRGREQSYCIFVSASDKKQTMERLSILNRSNDGFYIAGEDLRLRGPGDLFGIRQSGSMEFKLADIYQDAKILQEASEAAEGFLREHGGRGETSLAVFSSQVDFGSI